MAHPETPIGVHDHANLEVQRGKHEPRKFDFKPLDHVDLGQRLDLFDFEAGSKVTGHGFYFLKNDAVLLELALQQFAVNRLMKEGFTLTTTPDMARLEILEGIGFNPRGQETQIYSIQNTDLCLVATAEITLGGYYSGQILADTQLPIKMCGISHCFRTEAGEGGVPRVDCIACISLPRSKCSRSRTRMKAPPCTTSFAASNASCLMSSEFPIALWIPLPATWCPGLPQVRSRSLDARSRRKRRMG